MLGVGCATSTYRIDQQFIILKMLKWYKSLLTFYNFKSSFQAMHSYAQNYRHIVFTTLVESRVSCCVCNVKIYTTVPGVFGSQRKWFHKQSSKKSDTNTVIVSAGQRSGCEFAPSGLTLGILRQCHLDGMRS